MLVTYCGLMSIDVILAGSLRGLRKQVAIVENALDPLEEQLYLPAIAISKAD